MVAPAWLSIGILSLAVGAVGVVLPVLPTTPFLLVSAYAFARSSPRLHRWLLGHHRFGPLIENWQRYGAIDRATKRFSVIVMVLTPVVTWAFRPPVWALGVQIMVLITAATFVITRPEPGNPDNKKQ